MKRYAYGWITALCGAGEQGGRATRFECSCECSCESRSQRGSEPLMPVHDAQDRLCLEKPRRSGREGAPRGGDGGIALGVGGVGACHKYPT